MVWLKIDSRAFLEPYTQLARIAQVQDLNSYYFSRFILYTISAPDIFFILTRCQRWMRLYNCIHVYKYTNTGRERLAFKCNSVLQTFEASSRWSNQVFMVLCISYAIISRYCYKHDIGMHKYIVYRREYSLFMHWRCRTCRDQATRGISWAMREGRGYPSKYPKAEKGPHLPTSVQWQRRQ